MKSTSNIKLAANMRRSFTYILFLAVLALCMPVTVGIAGEPMSAEAVQVKNLQEHLSRNGIEAEIIERPQTSPFGPKSYGLAPVGTAVMVMVLAYPTAADAQQNFSRFSQSMGQLGEIMAIGNMIISFPWWSENATPLKAKIIDAVHSFKNGG